MLRTSPIISLLCQAAYTLVNFNTKVNRCIRGIFPDVLYYHSLEIFIWNYFVVRNVQENNFRGLPIPTKIFNNL